MKSETNLERTHHSHVMTHTYVNPFINSHVTNNHGCQNSDKCTNLSIKNMKNFQLLVSSKSITHTLDYIYNTI